MKQTKEKIAMFSDILDYLNTHQLRDVLSINTTKLDELAPSMQPNMKHPEGATETLRQLRAIREVLLIRLWMKDDLHRWPKK